MGLRLMLLFPKLSVSNFENYIYCNILKEFYLFRLSKFETHWDFQFLSASGGSPHLRRQIPSRIADYSRTTSSPEERDFAMLKTCRSEAEIPPRGAYLRQT